MQFEYDPEKLIEEVKKRPGIWDYDCIEYRQRSTRQLLWAEVVRELNQNTGQATKSELRELELQLQKKWKSIRDCFQKYIINPQRTKRPYIYTKQLQFLLKEGLETEEAAASSDSDAEKKQSKWKRKKKLKIKASHSEDEHYSVTLNDTNDHDERSNDDYEDEQVSINASRSTDHFAFANVDLTPKMDRSENGDSDKMFLLSLLPYLKSVPEHHRLNVKMELMQVLQNASYITKDTKI